MSDIKNMITLNGSSGNMVSPRPLRVSRKIIEKFAERVAREYLNFSYEDNIQYAAIKSGGRIIIGSTGDNTSNNRSLIARSYRDFTIYLSPFTSLVRDRFTIAHELGHLFLHLSESQKVSPSSPMFATRYVDKSDDEAMRAEWEANWFAAALLMPRDKFSKVYEENNGNLEKTAAFFNVGQPAASVRVNSLNLK